MSVELEGQEVELILELIDDLGAMKILKSRWWRWHEVYRWRRVVLLSKKLRAEHDSPDPFGGGHNRSFWSQFS